jgi:flagellar M-ring protein FliF
MGKLLANIPVRHRIAIAVVAALVAGGLYALTRWQKEEDFKPLFSGLAAEDAGSIIQKLKESGVEYRLTETGGAVLVPSPRLAELRIAMAAAGLPKSGRMGFELFDKANLGASEFTEHVNYRRALEGELERSIMSLAEVEQARVHITFPKDSVFLDAQQPAKASVLVKIRPGARMAAQNVQAIDHLVASAVEGLAPEAVSVVDMRGNLLGRPRPAGTLDGPEPSEATLDYRHKVEADLLAKIDSTLEPLLGSEKFRAGVSVDCDFSGAEQSEEIFDPTHSVMTSSQRTDDSSGGITASGVPGTASNLPRPAARSAAESNRVSRVTESITYQSSRTVKKTRLPAGTVSKISVAVLLDQDVTWQKDKNGYQKTLIPPTPEKLKVVHDLVAGITGFDEERGDQLVVETMPFESTLLLEPPEPNPGPAGPMGKPQPHVAFPLDRKTLLMAGGIGAGALLVLGIRAVFLRRSRKAVRVGVPIELPPGDTPAQGAVPVGAIEQQIESQLAEHAALQHKVDAQALHALKLAPVITKTAEVLAKHLREKVKQEPEASAQALRTWIREEES